MICSRSQSSKGVTLGFNPGARRQRCSLVMTAQQQRWAPEATRLVLEQEEDASTRPQVQGTLGEGMDKGSALQSQKLWGGDEPGTAVQGLSGNVGDPGCPEEGREPLPPTSLGTWGRT